MPFQLAKLPFSARLALSFLVLVFAGGLAASSRHLVLHHENRDERPGLSFDDLLGAYHGVTATAALIPALERGHPEGLPQGERDILLGWLASTRINEDYDNLDLGDLSPAEILDRRCLACHARASSDGDGIGQRVPLEYFDDVKKLAFSREIRPVDPEILIASAHTHSLSMALLTLAFGLLALATRWPRGLVGALFALSALALVCDLGAWFLARETAAFVWLVAGGGAVWMGTSALLLLLVLVDLWRPARAS